MDAGLSSPEIERLTNTYHDVPNYMFFFLNINLETVFIFRTERYCNWK